jgi:hypothetical protein
MENDTRSRTVPAAPLLLCILGIFWLAGCSGLSGHTRPTEDTAYLTPIPEATLRAFRYDAPIQNKLQAAIAARLEIGTARFGDTAHSAKIVSVEEMTLDKVKQRVGPRPNLAYEYEDRPGDTKVWLTVFEGDWQIFPPNSNTPLPPYHGCYYVIMDARGSGPMEIGNIDCPQAAGVPLHTSTVTPQPAGAP